VTQHPPGTAHGCATEQKETAGQHAQTVHAQQQKGMFVGFKKNSSMGSQQLR
jgi:hypothetical protein